jgi:hypothetical protein
LIISVSLDLFAIPKGFIPAGIRFVLRNLAQKEWKVAIRGLCLLLTAGISLPSLAFHM